jgi:hypothetical protein
MVPFMKPGLQSALQYFPETNVLFGTVHPLSGVHAAPPGGSGRSFTLQVGGGGGTAGTESRQVADLKQQCPAFLLSHVHWQQGSMLGVWLLLLLLLLLLPCGHPAVKAPRRLLLAHALSKTAPGSPASCALRACRCCTCKR